MGGLQRVRLLTRLAESERQVASKTGHRVLSKRVCHLDEAGWWADGWLPVSEAERNGGVPTRRCPPQVPGGETLHVASKIERPHPPTDGEVGEPASSRGMRFEAAQKMVEVGWVPYLLGRHRPPHPIR